MSARVAAAILALLLSGCGGGGDGESEAAGLPDCVRAGPPVRKRVLPPTFPLVSGTVLDSTRPAAAGFTVVEGYVPGSLDRARDFYVAELPKAGYRLGGGDSEAHEAETGFVGHGVVGHLRLRTIPDCEGALTIAVALRREE